VLQGQGADMYKMHQWIKQEGVDLLIGNTYGKYIARDENTPSSVPASRYWTVSGTSIFRLWDIKGQCACVK